MRDVEGRMGALMGDENASSSLSGQPSAIDVAVNGHRSTTEARFDKRGGDADTQTSSTTADTAKDPQSARLQALKKRVTITKDGKKRMAPLLVSNSNPGQSSLPQAQLRASAIHNSRSSNDGPQVILDLSKPYEGLPKGGMEALLLGNKRRLAAVDGDEIDQTEKRLANASRTGALPIMESMSEGLKPATVSAISEVQAPPEFVRPAVVNPSLSVSQVRLAVPKVRAHVVQNFTASKQGSKDSVDTSSTLTQVDAVFEARNPTGPAPTGRYEDREPSRVVLSRKGQPLWQDFLPRNTLLLAGGQQFWSAACEDGTVYAWSHSGIRLINAIVLESQPVMLESWGPWLLCITAVGMCYVWNIKTLSAPHPPVSLAPVLDIATQTLQSHTTKAPAITSARLNSEGRVIVTLTNGDGYAYSPTMFAWQRLSEVWWAVGSQYWNTTDSAIGNIKTGNSASGPGVEERGQSEVASGILPFLERQTTNETLVRGRAYALQRLVKQLLPREGYESFESNVSIAHLENRLAGALMLGAKQDFRAYLHMYARRLGAEGLRPKVDELLRTLIGHIYDGQPEPVQQFPNQPSDRYWQTESETICGWQRQDLLRDVILILGKHRDLQRITVPYSKILGIASESNGGQGLSIG